ncbi:gliding motility-associated ABC transporter substrate-binding protein GldG [Lutibacter sp. TH_r2]|uniref:gliding motility-associated ABC transporter substrate-binding protein GldG n=1 Tax=Lutibacter sp. TH_r2 TaxID=3082083 RepID=UPI0029553451|nr:gliding motility-associated ABC transporter substrate-binding protein GldG [Lutibacter sp. TH_r2]MDV7187268.1 gliding motility-associated ABC transporter substrate-binding protein GldG [Lutibacter sp. TH_r2]
MKNKFANILGALAIVVLLNFVASKFYQRFDLTEDQRYTLSEATKNIVKNIDDFVTIKVYLEGDFPAEFKRLQTETKLHLEELKAVNKNIRFRFINPEDEIEDLINQGLQPSRLQIQENGKLSELVILPWAVVESKNKKENVSLLKDNATNSQDEQLENSIQNLEYAFANAIHKTTSKKSKSIAILKGNGELDDIYIADFLKTLSEYYLLAPFTLDSVLNSPQKTLEQLNSFDLAIIAKPTEKFSEEEKFVIDQYSMNGGKSIWLIDNVQAELDSLMNTGESLAYPRDLGLTDFFFNYGARINHDLIADLYSSEITLATGNIGNQTQFSQFQWEYYPLVNSLNNHSINNNIEMVTTKFTNSIDTLKNKIKKTILLQSSSISKTLGTPQIISLKSIAEEKKQENYANGNKSIAVLLEGEFKSAFNGRVKPFTISNALDKGKESKLILISDGDIIANDVSKGKPLQLGVDKWTGQRFGNKEFLLNCINYLLDDSGLINVRSKTVKIDFLNKQKAFEESKKWQFINLLFPLILLAFFGFIFNFFRRKKYQ